MNYSPDAHPHTCPEGIARQRENEALADELTTLAGHINAGLARFLEVLERFDEAKGWCGEGILSLAHWLNWRCGVGSVAAREYVRVARALPGLPGIRAAFGRGEVSYSKVRAMTRVATQENEDYLLMIAAHGTAAHVERLVRGYRRVLSQREDRARAVETYERRTLTLSEDWEHEGMVRVRGLLPSAEAAVVERALGVLMEGAYRVDRVEAARDAEAPAPDVTAETSESVVGTWLQGFQVAEERGARRADALVRMAEHVLGRLREARVGPESGPRDVDALLGSVPGGEGIEVRLHVDWEVLSRSGEGGRCELEGSGARRRALQVESARRLACDAARVTFLDGPEGEPLSVGRRTRTLSAALRRALHSRDGGCRFPGCARTMRVEGHHVRHWADGGETALSNLVTLCRYHHRLVHEEGFGVEPCPEGGFRFRRPDGEVLGDRAVMHTTHWMNLVDRHRGLGLDIDEQTIVPYWLGEGMDCDLGIWALMRRDGIPLD